MFGSDVIEVGIGVSLLFLFVSLICTAIRELVEGWTKTRAMDVERGLREILDDKSGTELVKSFFSHPQIFALFAGAYDPAKLVDRNGRSQTKMPFSGRHNLPSYIPASNFAIALIDIVAHGAVSPEASVYPPPTGGLSVQQVRAGVNTLGSSKVQRAVRTALDWSGGDIENAKTHLEEWFNSSMDRVSGWYKRRTQIILFLLGLAAACTFNIDAVHVTKRLILDKSLRAAVIAQAEKIGATSHDDVAKKDLSMLRSQFDAIGFPVGWPAPQGVHSAEARTSLVFVTLPHGCSLLKPGDQLGLGASTSMFLGWIITALAVTLGAPFWFDVLSKFMTIRSSLKPAASRTENKPKADGRVNDGAGVALANAPTLAPAAGEGYVARAWNYGDPQEGAI